MSDSATRHINLLELEFELNRTKFKGYEIGATLSDSFVVHILNENVPSWVFLRFSVKLLLQFLSMFARSPRHPIPVCARNKVVFTWIHERPELREMVLPLVESYGAKDVVVLGSQPSMRPALSAEAGFLIWSDIRFFPKWKWLINFCKAAPGLLWTLGKASLRGKIAFKLLPLLWYHLVQATQRILACEEFVSHAAPLAVVTEADRNWFASCLVLAANRYQIPTVTMVHGPLNPYPAYGMFPILANLVMVWGELQREQLLDCGVDPAKIHITGCHRLSRRLHSDRYAVRDRLGLAQEQKLVLLATNPIRPLLKRKLALDFCDALKGLEGVIGAIRLHPAESPSEYSDITDGFRDVQILPKSELSVDESLAACDAVVCHNTGFGSDAVMKGRHVVILDTIDQPLLNAKELIERAGTPVARSAAELRAHLESMFAKGPEAAKWQAGASNYTALLCSFFEDEALAKETKLLHEVVRGGDIYVR